MFIELLGKRWNLIRKPLGRHRIGGHRVDGFCTNPQDPNKQIQVDSRLTELDELETLIHEMNHAMNWSLSEAHVTESSRDMARSLWKLGYRKVKDGKLGTAKSDDD